MPKFKEHYTLLVCGLFRVGQWNHYPEGPEILRTLNERFENAVMINGERITFKIEKEQFLDMDDLQANEDVKVINDFYFNGTAFKKDQIIRLTQERIDNGFEKFVIRHTSI